MDKLLIKYLLGELEPEEIERVDKWLSENDHNRRVLEQLRAIWELSRPTRPAAKPDPETALLRLRQRLETARKTGEYGAESIKVRRGRILYLGPNHWRIAGLFTGVLFAGALYFFVINPVWKSRITTKKQGSAAGTEPVISKTFPGKIPPGLQEIIAGKKIRIDTLADKSVITLNRHSVIEYQPGLKGTERTIFLGGEAFFSVMHDPSRPFIVHINDITVMDLGTSFNILGIAGETEVDVETGTVLLLRGRDSLNLSAGEKIIVRSGEILKKERGRDKLYAYYLDRPMICDSIPLRRLVEILNKAYDAHIIIGKKEYDNLPISTRFRHGEALEKILQVIVATFDIALVRQGQTIILN